MLRLGLFLIWTIPVISEEINILVISEEHATKNEQRHKWNAKPMRRL